MASPGDRRVIRQSCTKAGRRPDNTAVLAGVGSALHFAPVTQPSSTIQITRRPEWLSRLHRPAAVTTSPAHSHPLLLTPAVTPPCLVSSLITVGSGAAEWFQSGLLCSAASEADARFVRGLAVWGSGDYHSCRHCRCRAGHDSNACKNSRLSRSYLTLKVLINRIQHDRARSPANLCSSSFATQPILAINRVLS